MKKYKEIIIVYIVEYTFMLGILFIYSLKNPNNLTYFTKYYLSLMTIILNIIIIYYLIKKKYKKEPKIKLTNYFKYILLGIGYSLLMNMLIFLIQNKKDINILPIIISLISSGIVGPILEEILFRYLLFNRLLEKHSLKLSILISSIIFGIVHFNVITSIYAFILGIILSYFYNKEKNVLVPIIIHASGNIIVTFIYEFNIYILLLSIIILIIGLLIYKKES